MNKFDRFAQAPDLWHRKEDYTEEIAEMERERQEAFRREEQENEK